MSVDAVSMMSGLVGPISSGDGRRATPKEAAAEFEALLVTQLLSAMPIAALDGKETSTFRSLMLESLAQQIVAGGGIGLAAQIEQALARREEPGTAAPTVGSRFGVRLDPFDGTERLHEGVDLPAPAGTPVRAAGDGTVSFAGPAGGYGNLVVVDHGDGLQTRYAHCAEITVRVGDPVARGGRIGTVGSTGRSTGPHLHFEVRRGGVAIDPSPLLDPKADRLPIREAGQGTLSPTEGPP